MQSPRFQISQERALAWLTDVHAQSESTKRTLSSEQRADFAARFSKLVKRCACGPDKIGARGHSVDLASKESEDHALYDVGRHPQGLGTVARSRLFAEVVDSYFETEYAEESTAPSELIHVTCTGYVAPSGAQRLVAKKDWGSATRVTHAYHMGCYAALPAIRIAAGSLGLPAALGPDNVLRRADIVHTELCTLHLDPSDHSMEQCVVQSLFGDGFIRYSVFDGSHIPGLSILSLSEDTLPDSTGSMGWSVGDFGMRMTLARDVPEKIAASLRPFVTALFRKANISVADNLGSTVFAVHPGGPKIIDHVRDTLALRNEQLQTSRNVLFEHGNMSSATLPHVWMRIVGAPEISVGTLVLSLAFGPGLTVCGGLFRKTRGSTAP
ncbi:MAG: 3-oxoacyl-[acyl-carrier-protein] synthase III C-terminal domain-containing protein [Polyangiaceae bacterium]|nr:3-oxoacyl-[acyl-carrier-protein] synthase III C-terminal domain-containing protein [Polyangiaceae bacterium]